jgi:hypothetical protein
MRGTNGKLVSVSLAVAGLSLLILSTQAVGQEAPKSHRDLDWQAPRRWVHVDNVDPQKASLFVNARLGWLATLRRDDGLLGDGRPLFWHARSSKAGETFFSFYPFRTWADLDARGQMATETVKVVGEDALKAYDSGDEALVSPHYSQIWSRVAEYDIAVPATDSLTELTAMAGRLEVHSVDITRWDVFEQSWKQITDTLVAAEYPQACRFFRSTYGKGEYMVWWLAPDSAAYMSAPSIQDVLDAQLGSQRSAELRGALDAVFPVEAFYDVERRADLSNLGM